MEKRGRVGNANDDEGCDNGGNKKSEKRTQEMNGEKHNNNEKNDRQTGKDATFICPKGYAALVDRRFDEAIDNFLEWVSSSSSTMTLSADTEDDCCIDEGREGERSYPVPRTTSLISNLTFSRDGLLPITTTTADNKSNDASLSRGHSSSIASSSTLSSHVSEDAATPPPPTTMATKQLHSNTQQNSKAPSPQQTLLLPSEATSSALAKSYRSLAFQTLADQVKRSVRSHDGNEWMFNVKNAGDMPLCWSQELLRGIVVDDESNEGKVVESEERESPMLVERTPVRMDLSHVSWIDELS